MYINRRKRKKYKNKTVKNEENLAKKHTKKNNKKYLKC